MINRRRLRPPYGGAHISSISAASSSSLSGTDPVVGAFIAGPIGALIGRILGGMIEAVTKNKVSTLAGETKVVPKTFASPVNHKTDKAATESKKLKGAGPGSAGVKRSRRRRAKK